MPGEVQIQIGEVVHGGEPVGQGGIAEAGVVRGDHTIVLGQRVQPGAVGIEAFAGMQEQQLSASPAFNQFQVDPGHRYHLGHSSSFTLPGRRLTDPAACQKAPEFAVTVRGGNND